MSEKNISICCKVSYTLVFMLLFQFSNAQYNFKELDAKLETNKKELGNSVVAMIYKDGKIIYTKKIGEFDEKTQAPIASASKWLTAALVMQFIDEGKLSLDTKIADYLPIYAKYSKKYITIRHCLAHLTGIENKKGLAAILEGGKFETLDEEVNDYAKKEIRANAGTDFYYGSIGLNIAARVVEIIAKKNFEQLMNVKLLRPLNMRNTNFTPLNNRCVNPSGGAVSTAADYTNFLSMILNKGMFNGKRILSEASIEMMQTPQMTSNMIAFTPAATTSFDYGLGEWIQEKDANGKTTVVSSPGLFGTWPLVDICRGYCCIFFVKNNLGEVKSKLYLDLKATIDNEIASTCK